MDRVDDRRLDRPCPCGHVFAPEAPTTLEGRTCPKCGSRQPVVAPAPENDLEKIIILKGWANAEQVKLALAFQAEQRSKGRELRLGEALVEQGVLKPDQVRQALALQDKVPMRCPTCKKVFNVRGYRPGTRALCKVCKVLLVPPGSSTDLHADDTTGGLQQVQVGEAVDAALVDLVPGYAIERRLGAGGMGDVYLAKQKSLDRLVAIKVLPETLGKDPIYVQRFLSEARSAARLKHENIVAAVDSGEVKGRYYFVMEFVEGETLQDVLAREKVLPEKRALGLARQIARGLQHAQLQGIIHRDIKPANVMIGFDGNAKICDFGLARDVTRDVTLTQAGQVHSSPAYASPEQCRGRRDLDHRSDMYSLGVTLFEMLTGLLPFDENVPSALFVKHVTENPPSPLSLNPSLSMAANQLILRLLRKHPEGRFKDYTELLSAIDAVERGARVAPSNAPALRVSTRRRPSWIPLVIGASVCLVTLAGLLLFRRGSAPSSEDGAGSSVPGLTDAQARREFQAARDSQQKAQADPARFPEVRSRWRSLEERYRGTQNHPFFAGAMVEFDTFVAGQASKAAEVATDRARRLRDAGKAGEALLELREFPAGYAGTEGQRHVEALREELRQGIDRGYAEIKERLLANLTAEKFDEARRDLALLRMRVSVDSGGATRFLEDRYAEELKALGRTIEEEGLLARQKEAQAKTPAPAPATPPGPAAVAEATKTPALPAAPGPAPTPTPRPDPAPKIPPPLPAARKEAEGLVRDLFKEDYARKAASDRLALSRKLLQLARETKDDQAGRYVLLQEAAEAAAQAGDLGVAFEAVRELATVFEVDLFLLKAGVLASAVNAARSDDQFRGLARATLTLGEEAAEAGNAELAHKHAVAALSHAKRARDVALASAADARVKEYAETKALGEQMAKAREQLAANPADLGAAQKLALHQCAVLGDWKAALPLLAKASDAPIKRAAEKDLAAPSDPQAQGELGDAWLEAAEKAPDWAKAGLHARASEWFERAFAGLGGIHRIRIEQRLAQIPVAGDRESWFRIRGPKPFGWTGAIDEPFQVSPPANDSLVAAMEPFPAGAYDGVSVKVGLPNGGRAQAFLVFEVRGFAVYVQRQNNTTMLTVADVGPAPRNIHSDRFPPLEEYKLEALIEGKDYVVRVNDKDFFRVPTSRTTLSGIGLQASWNPVRFSDLKLRRKK